MKLEPLPDRRPRRPVAAAFAADFLAVAAGWFVFNIIRFHSLPHAYSMSLPDWMLTPTVLLGLLIVPLCMVGIYAFCGCYYRRRLPETSRLDVVLNALGVSLAGMLGIFFTVLLNDDVPERLANYEIMLILFLCLSVPVIVERLVFTSRRTRRMLSRGQGVSNAMIVNATPGLASHISKICTDAAESGYRIVAVHSSEPLPAGTFGDLAICGGVIAQECLNRNIQAVFLPVSEGSTLSSKEVMNPLYRLEMPVIVVPRGSGMYNLGPRLSAVRTEPMVDVASANITRLAANCKRLADIAGSALALVLLSPVLAAVAVAVKLDSPGPVFYRQERLGFRRRRFSIVKFRTMRTDAEASGPQLTSENDPRVTRLGRWLRKYRIDELPQFWNVLKGEMSIVGPRPERPFFAAQLIDCDPAYTLIHHVRPGITSWGMVKYGYASTVDQMLERMAYDILYIQNVSMAIDLKILLHTVATVAAGRGM